VGSSEHSFCLIHNVIIYLCIYFLVGLGFELRAECLQNRCFTTPPVHFALVILEMGPYKLFALAVLKLWPSRSQPPK
jgi:hypothetical protein